MKTKVEKERIVGVPESMLLSLVASKLKDKILFPKKIESAKEYLNKIQASGVKLR